MPMQEIKKDFILDVALSNTQSSAFQRANVYNKNVKDKDIARIPLHSISIVGVATQKFQH